MKPLPNSKYPLVLRTDYSDPAAWRKIVSIIRKPVSVFKFLANVDFLDDSNYEDLDKSQLLDMLARNYKHSFIFVVDRSTVASPEYPILVVDLYESPGREFRAIPSEIQGIENNLSIANMDFDEFARAVDEDGVFRGFSEG